MCICVCVCVCVCVCLQTHTRCRVLFIVGVNELFCFERRPIQTEHVAVVVGKSQNRSSRWAFPVRKPQLEDGNERNGGELRGIVAARKKEGATETRWEMWRNYVRTKMLRRRTRAEKNWVKEIKQNKKKKGKKKVMEKKNKRKIWLICRKEGRFYYYLLLYFLKIIQTFRWCETFSKREPVKIHGV